MLAAAKLILHSHRLATKHSCLASTGILTLSPGSTNTVPGTVQFSLDIRAGEDDQLMRLEENLKADFEKIAKGEDVDGLNEGGTPGRGCTVQWTLDAPSTAIKFDESCIRCVEQSTEGLFGAKAASLMQAMISGAGKTFRGQVNWDWELTRWTGRTRQRLYQQKGSDFDGFRTLQRWGVAQSGRVFCARGLCQWGSSSDGCCVAVR